MTKKCIDGGTHVWIPAHESIGSVCAKCAEIKPLIPTKKRQLNNKNIELLNKVKKCGHPNEIIPTQLVDHIYFTQDLIWLIKEITKPYKMTDITLK